MGWFDKVFPKWQMTSFAAASECARKLERNADSQDVADLAPQSHCTVLPLKLTSRGTQIKEFPPQYRQKSPRELLAASPHGAPLLSPLLRHGTALETTSWCNLEIKKRTCGGRIKKLPVIGHLLSALSLSLSKFLEIKTQILEYNCSCCVSFSLQDFPFRSCYREHFPLLPIALQ